VRLLWNWLLPPLFGWRTVTFWQRSDCWRSAGSLRRPRRSRRPPLGHPPPGGRTLGPPDGRALGADDPEERESSEAFGALRVRPRNTEGEGDRPRPRARSEPVLEAILPRTLDNTARGHPLAIWLFVRSGHERQPIALGTVFNGRGAAQSADGIRSTASAPKAPRPCSRSSPFGNRAARAEPVGALALVRYRSMIPLMFSLLSARAPGEAVGLAAQTHPQERHPPGGYINLALLVLMVVAWRCRFGRDGRPHRVSDTARFDCGAGGAP